MRESEYALTRAGETVAVEPTAFRVLIYLLRNAGRLVTKDEMIEAVWQGSAVSDNSLTRAVATLRRLLGDNPREPRLIATIQTIGYRFLVPVETISADGAGGRKGAVSEPADPPIHKDGLTPDGAVSGFSAGFGQAASAAGASLGSAGGRVCAAACRRCLSDTRNEQSGTRECKLAVFCRDEQDHSCRSGTFG